MKIGKSLGKSVTARASRSSLQLTLEHKDLHKAVAGYSKPLAGLLKGKKDVIGYAVAINGKVSSADIYGSAVLFNKLWPKMLHAAVVEAIAERNGKKSAPVNTEAVNTFLTEITTKPVVVTKVTKRIQLTQHEAKNTVLFETRDLVHQMRIIHRCYLAK
jgi:hypothetical protein